MRTTFVDQATCAIANVSQNPDGTWDLNRINVPAKYRGVGVGSALLIEVLGSADAEGIDLYLDLNPYGALNYEQLEAWYARHGFVWHKGRMRRLARVKTG